MRRLLATTLALMLATRGAAAQDEGALRAAFEGKTVVVRIDMPATSQGVDVYPQDGTPINYREVAERLKEHGTAIRIGQSMMVTKVVVKKNSHIEFQLGGGGYGTFGDYTGSSVSPVAAAETKEERALRESIRQTADKGAKQKLQRELDGLRTARERENARAAAEATQANAARDATLRARRVEGGSRFNVRYRQGIPPEALTPQGVMRALAPYVEFANGTVASGAAGAATTIPAAALREPAGAGGVAALRKGLLTADVEALLGPAATAAESKEGTLTLTRRTYRRDGMLVTARFVSGVLIDFAITPQ